MPGLREKQRELTDQLIIDAFTELTVKNPDFTMQELADVAGVSLRTLYRYYPSREVLVEGLMRTLTDRVRVVPTTLEAMLDKPGALRHNFRVFDEYSELMRAMVLSRLTGALDQDGSRNRTKALKAAISAELSDKHETIQQQVFGLTRLLMGSVAWMFLTEDDIGLTGDEAGAAVEWATRLIVDAARRSDGPLE